MEKVLCFDVSRLWQEIPYFNGFSSEYLGSFNKFIAEAYAIFVDKDKAESDFELKQLIPYCVVTYNDRILVYERTKKGGEARLHNLMSCGIGGHINEEDRLLVHDYHLPLVPNAFWNCVERELKEELGLNEDSYIIKNTIGLINDDSNDVGKVHLGQIIEIELLNINSINVEHSLTNIKFLTREEIIPLLDRFETWSQHVLKGWYLSEQKKDTQDQS